MAPMIEETMSMVRSLVSGTWCARRKDPSVMLIPGADKGLLDTGVASPDPSPKHGSDSEDSAEISTTCGRGESDRSLGSTDGSTDDSEAEVDSPSSLMQSSPLEPMWIPPPPGLGTSGLAPPPGLELPAKPAGLQLQTEKPQGPTRLTSQAAPFVPGQGKPDTGSEFDKASMNLQHKLFQLKGALAEWEACMPTTHHSAPPAPSAPVSASVQEMLDAEKSAYDLASKVSTFMAAQAGTSAVSPGFPLATEAMEMVVGQNMFATDMAAGSPQFPSMSQQVTPNRSMLNVNAEPWGGCVTSPSYQTQPWQRGNRSSTKAMKPQTARATQEESSADDARDTLRTNLKILETLDASRIIIVRRINRLGLDSAAILKSHYSRHGIVEQMFISHSRVRSTNRVRPAGLGFILMSTKEETQAILNLGVEQIVQGAVIQVHSYEDRVAECQDASAKEMQFSFQ